VSYLKQAEQITLADSVAGTEKGLIHLHKQWAETIGQEFVSSTRFDPFHQAASEQELYNRLPGILYNLQHSPSIAFDMTGGSRTYGITLTRDLIARKAASVYTEIRRIIEGLRTQHQENESSTVLLLTHRLARLPGCRQILAGLKNTEIVLFDYDKPETFDPALKIGQRVQDAAHANGLYLRAIPPDRISFMPPLIIEQSEIDDALTILRKALDIVWREIR